jgi:hypothetical protein
MAEKRYSLRARVSTENTAAAKLVLQQFFPGGSIRPTDDPKELRVEGLKTGESARDLNRSLLSALRQVEKRTRLRSEWTCGRLTERFFDYVPKGKRRAPPNRSVQS